ncbi:transglutaminase domain-containing protein (plasmid) [Paroceanicella profunda]|uniref:Transglutaminase domain-containing protein n=1 Tax=Paroceanicella profunda TaxID=2579971 RepID=A0A5B8G661_9RHOB|nr:transglutaminase domain-containing protein [Paroceanicella profunda]
MAFGYNRADDIPASEVLSDGYGQCNTKGTLLMALLRGVGIRCRLPWVYDPQRLAARCCPRVGVSLAPQEILHSWLRSNIKVLGST